MSLFNRSFYSLLCLTRNKYSLNIINRIANINDFNKIAPNLYLGNINMATNLVFLKEHNIQAIVNCTENESFHEYFDDKAKFRININDSKSDENINNFKTQIIDAIEFIDNNINENKCVYIHCYWGLMRSATLVTAYLIKKYNIPIEDAINIVKEERPMSLSSIYNFNEVLKFVEEKYNDTPK